MPAAPELPSHAALIEASVTLAEVAESRRHMAKHDDEGSAERLLHEADQLDQVCAWLDQARLTCAGGPRDEAGPCWVCDGGGRMGSGQCARCAGTGLVPVSER